MVEQRLYLRASPLSLFVQQVKAAVQRSIRAHCHVKCQELEFEKEKVGLWRYLYLPGWLMRSRSSVLVWKLKLKPLCTECLFGSRHWNPQMETGTPKTPSGWETRLCWRSAGWIPYSAHSWSSDLGPWTCKLKSRPHTGYHTITLWSYWIPQLILSSP